MPSLPQLITSNAVSLQTNKSNCTHFATYIDKKKSNLETFEFSRIFQKQPFQQARFPIRRSFESSLVPHPSLSQGRPSDSENGCKVKKARKSKRGTGEGGAVQKAFPLSPLPPPSFLFFRAPFYFAPLPTGAGTGYPHPLFSGSRAGSFPDQQLVTETAIATTPNV